MLKSPREKNVTNVAQEYLPLSIYIKFIVTFEEMHLTVCRLIKSYGKYEFMKTYHCQNVEPKNENKKNWTLAFKSKFDKCISMT